MFSHIYIILFLSSLFNALWCWQVRLTQPNPQSKHPFDQLISGPSQERLNLIFPGTKWYGSGSVAGDYDDLGSLQGTDLCCREHDFCPDNLEAGTKWCGSGSVAGDYDDLGSLQGTDLCCREHDFCPDILEAGQSGHGLTNDAFYTRLHCDCDSKFMECLKSDGSEHSYTIAFLYFNALNTQCYKEDFPIVQCTSYYLLTKRCKTYELNVTAEKIYQFFDVPLLDIHENFFNKTTNTYSR